jgi:formylglycine-generating enzyme required for sulfatase activity
VTRWSFLCIAACTTAQPRPAPAPPPAPVHAIVPAPAQPPPPAPAAPEAPPAPALVCEKGEVLVPGTGPEGFLMGKGSDRPHRVILTHAFCMDATEVTVKDYKKCVEAGACKEPWRGDPWSMYPAFPEHPVNVISWPKSRAYCEWAKKRLPTEAEWEWAATGPEQNKYPWGNTPEPSCEEVDFTRFGAPKFNPGGDVGCHGGGPSPVGAHPKGARRWPGGELHDLAGNVWEWVEDSHAPYPTETQTDPLVRQESAVHTIRGGGWNRSYAAMDVTYRAAAHFTYQVPAIGFRCVRGEPHPTPPPRH